MMRVLIDKNGEHIQIGGDMDRDVADRLVGALIEAGVGEHDIYATLSPDEYGSGGEHFAQARVHLLGV